ncbi:MAG: hypothetical protein US74_C0003G0023 [Parcubacteria group bacterium GW2011_GWA2_38_13]|nr:MAG: hypothetical protein US74_C0003G0023 [Parcubacteria group bacterium GW2011_GWA2_38_13]
MNFQPKFRVKITITKKVFYIISFIFIFIIVVFTGFFLYTFVYQSIISSNDIAIKRQEVAPESFSKNEFEKIILKIQDKKNSRFGNEIEKMSNFFLENRIVSSTAQILPDTIIEKTKNDAPLKDSENIINE